MRKAGQPSLRSDGRIPTSMVVPRSADHDQSSEFIRFPYFTCLLVVRHLHTFQPSPTRRPRHAPPSRRLGVRYETRAPNPPAQTS